MDLDIPAKRLQWAREQHGKYATPTDAARAFGWPISTYLGHENGDRNPSRTAAKRYAKAYKVRWEWLLEGEGSANEKKTTKIAGKVEPGSKVEFYKDPAQLGAADFPPNGTIHTVALEVRGGSMRGIADSGWLIYFDDEKRPPSADLLGKLCVVELVGGNVLVRVLGPGRKRGRYDLESATEPTLRDQRIVWAARVTWIKPR